MFPRSPSPAARAGALVLGAVLLAGCADGGDPPPSGTGAPATTARPAATVPAGHATGTTAPEPGAPVVVAVELQSVITCVGPATVEVPVTYDTTGASAVAVLVDGEQVTDLGDPDGIIGVPIPCDDATHVVVLTAIAPDGRTGVESRVVSTSTTPVGN